MTNGFRTAGINVLAGIDFDPSCKKTYESNNEGAKFIEANIKELSFKELQSETDITRNDDDLIFIGCSPCQYWSKIKTDKAKSAESKNLLVDFQKFVNYFKPGFVVIENVPGILTKKHESPLNAFLGFLKRNGYQYSYSVIDSFKYGVPQTRKRFLLIASRLAEVGIPRSINGKVPTVRQFISEEKGFTPIKAGTVDRSHFLHTACNLSPMNLTRLKKTPKDGGTRMTYANNKQLAIPTQYRSKSFSDTYGRMYWDRPGPTITTKFFSISNGRFAHPEQNRAISLREGATLQTFNKSYRFYGTNIEVIARHIGNAVPPLLAKHIAQHIIKFVNNGPRKKQHRT